MMSSRRTRASSSMVATSRRSAEAGSPSGSIPIARTIRPWASSMRLTAPSTSTSGGISLIVLALLCGPDGEHQLVSGQPVHRGQLHVPVVGCLPRHPPVPLGCLLDPLTDVARHRQGPPPAHTSMRGHPPTGSASHPHPRPSMKASSLVWGVRNSMPMLLSKSMRLCSFRFL